MRPGEPELQGQTPLRRPLVRVEADAALGDPEGVEKTRLTKSGQLHKAVRRTRSSRPEGFLPLRTWTGPPTSHPLKRDSGTLTVVGAGLQCADQLGDERPSR
jgi:hypothetical protein